MKTFNLNHPSTHPQSISQFISTLQNLSNSSSSTQTQTILDHNHSNHHPILRSALNRLRLASLSVHHPWKPPTEFFSQNTSLPFLQAHRSHPLGPIDKPLSLDQITSLELQLLRFQSQLHHSNLTPAQYLQSTRSIWKLLHHYLGICHPNGFPHKPSILQAIRLLQPFHQMLSSISHHHYNTLTHDQDSSSSSSPARTLSFLHRYLQHFSVCFDRLHHTTQPLTQDSLLVQYLQQSLALNHNPLDRQLLKFLETSDLSLDLNSFTRLWAVLLRTPRPSPPLLNWFSSRLISHYSSTQLKLTSPAVNPRRLSRLLAMSLGYLISDTSANNRKLTTSRESDSFGQRVNHLLALQQSWQTLAPCPELDQRRIQLMHLLGQTPDPVPTSDPYLISTLLRTASSDQQLDTIIKRATSGGQGTDCLKLLSVIGRSKGHLIQLDSTGQAVLQTLSPPASPLALAQVLIARIRASPPDQALDHLHRLLSLDIAPDDGAIERHRLRRRQADGLATFLQPLLQRLTPPFDQILNTLDRLPDQGLLRPRLLTELFRAHIRLPRPWAGPGGLRRLLVFLLQIHPPPTRVWPSDLGLVVLERTLFPSDAIPDESFEEDVLRERLTVLLTVLGHLGRPRRLRSHRLLRLIFLAVRRTRPSWAQNLEDKRVWKSLEATVAKAEALDHMVSFSVSVLFFLIQKTKMGFLFKNDFDFCLCCRLGLRRKKEKIKRRLRLRKVYRCIKNNLWFMHWFH